MTPSSYDKLPEIRIDDSTIVCDYGWTETCDTLRKRIPASGRHVFVVECYPGTDRKEIETALQTLEPATLVQAESAMLSAARIETKFSGMLGDDPVFGRMQQHIVDDFYDQELVRAQRALIRSARGLIVVYGTGAAYMAECWQTLVFVDVVRWEIQRRQRSGSVGNIGLGNAGTSPGEIYKRAYFLDWRVADIEKLRLHQNMDFYVDHSRPGAPAMISGIAYRSALREAARRPFRVVPFFDPGPWGGEWMRHTFNLPAEAPNYAWCFDCVPEENSLRFRFGNKVLETPALTLVHTHPQELLGEDIVNQFGAEFPIRFDLLDTVGGGNLSLQVHPIREYIAQHFNMPYTQDESYYLLHTERDASVYLGLKENIDPRAMTRQLRAAQQDGSFDPDLYVSRWPAKRHDHFSIPAGTIHCSGRNSVVLEISATPYIFTFKLWDWGRVGLNGKPRPLHVERGIANIRWERTTEWVRRELVNPITELAAGPGWREERTGLHELEFLETRRHWFTVPVKHNTNGTLNVLNLVQGDAAVVESPRDLFPPLTVHFAETFIIPAIVGEYRVRPIRNCAEELATVKASVRRRDHPT